ncbi:ceramidase [Leptospira ryugenii]|uniref:Neutral ceramidase n=1 Tax=Leptospira ryugenii TaxID=1917863 RepID=A0A2P2E0D7_9LEPT|nr:neutral/alkaline non-lysosomal ceramidase N-terminal domain-containing protein [Leptospira ryugenii]GBF50339.1 ceramidase [Leptospira ryugenii]
MKSIFTLVLVLFSLKGLYAEEAVYSVGLSKKDITGPPFGLMFWGYAREDQTGVGIQTRQFARSLVMEERKTGKLLAYVTAEVGGIPFEVQREVVKRLQKEVDPKFHLGNVVLNASHTHSGPAGFFQYSEVSFYSTNYYSQVFSLLCDGIFSAIRDAYHKRIPSTVYLGKAMVKDAGINRSLDAYNANPQEERQLYSDTIEREMTQLNFVAQGKKLGHVNWYGVHPTNITFDNRLISSDNKGVAALLSEEQALNEGHPSFVAIFAQANEGDVSPNLNLNNTGPGKEMYESSFLIGKRQFLASQEIWKGPTRELKGGMAFAHTFIDMSQYKVSAEFSRTGKEESTCPSAYGYAFAAGSTEEGGGHWLFHEGMTDKHRRFYIDWIAKFMLQSPSEELRNCQKPKAVLFPMGETKPIPSLPQILPYGMVRIGDLLIMVLPHEVTTMSARRLKKQVRSQFPNESLEVVISGLSNDFSGYITTPEEYSEQHYEGGHTLHGKQSLNALRQEFHRMASHMREGFEVSETIGNHPFPLDLSERVRSKEIPFTNETSTEPKEILIFPKPIYKIGEEVRCRVEAANPNVGYPMVKEYFIIEKRLHSAWLPIKTEAAIDTKIEYQTSRLPWKSLGSMDLSWTIGDRESGEYRLVHKGMFQTSNGKKSPYTLICPSFRVDP